MAPKKHSKTGPKTRKSTVKASAGKNQALTSYSGAAKKTKSTKKTTATKKAAARSKLSKVVTTTTTKTEAYYQTGVHGRSHAALQMDAKRKAKLPGWRPTPNGGYYERRANRSDTPGERRNYDERHGRR